MTATKDIALVLGTRPELVKLAPVIHELKDRARVVHTGQHYDRELSGQFLDQLEIGAPDVLLSGVGGSDRGTQIATAIQALTTHFKEDPPAVVVVQGDTNAVSAGAQAANYLGIPVVHVEAGLRSFDRGMPEEINRLVAGCLSDVHCAATAHNVANLISEGVPAARIALTGNTIVQATTAALSRANEPITRFFPGEIPHQFVLATIHRPENTDTLNALRRVLIEFRLIPVPVVFIIHPRTRNAIRRFELESLLDGIVTVESVGHSDFLALAKHASLLISDSGGVQEEATILRKRLLVVRRSTERMESIWAGFAQLVLPDQSIAGRAIEILADRDLEDLSDRPSPYGDEKAGQRIANMCRHLSRGLTAEESVALEPQIPAR